jgi:hypothetical protein
MNRSVRFEDLPDWAQASIKTIQPFDYESSINDPVPALGERSVAEVFRCGAEGEAELRKYFARVLGKFFDVDESATGENAGS